MASSNWFDSQTILDGIRRWVEIETPTEAPEQVNKLVSAVAEQYRDLPVTLERVAGVHGCGDHLVVRSNWGQDRPGILVLSHLDTVHPMGFIERLPFKVEGDVAFGPGIYDMKGGAYIAHHAFAALCAEGDRSPLGITHMFTSDEEIGSPTSRALIEQEGRKAKFVLVTEPARDGGKIVTGRKGVGRFKVSIKGVPAHAGSRPEDGRSAVREPRQRHPGSGRDERPRARRHRQCRRGARRHAPQRYPRRSLCRSRFARAEPQGRRGVRRQDPWTDVEDRRRHRHRHG